MHRPPSPRPPLNKSVLLAALLACALPGALRAQLPSGLPLSVEVRGGGAFPIGDFGDEESGFEAMSGFSFDVGAVFHATRTLGVYGAYQRASFGCDQCELFDIEDDVVDSGFALGAQATLGGPVAGFQPWVRAGALFHELTFSGNDPEQEAEFASEPAVGFQVAAGLAYPLLRSLTLTPALGFRAYSAKFDLGAGFDDPSVDVSYLTLDLGLSYRL